MTQTIPAPSRGLLFLELRAIPEFFGMAATFPTLATVCPRGDGHPVLVLPGLITTDRSTIALRTFLATLGYDAHGWNLGRNFGPLPGIEKGLKDRVSELSERHGGKVSLVGWSLGGIYARQLAKIMPDNVRQVISLGSPFKGDPRSTNAWRLYQMTSGDTVETKDRHMGGKIADTPPVPTTSIYSKSDGICAWQNCIEEVDETTENIEVKGSHCGLGHHPAAMYAIADRLAQAEGDWVPFDRNGFKSIWYPRPSRGT